MQNRWSCEGYKTMLTIKHLNLVVGAKHLQATLVLSQFQFAVKMK